MYAAPTCLANCQKYGQKNSTRVDDISFVSVGARHNSLFQIYIYVHASRARISFSTLSVVTLQHPSL